jgi:hypothetical protein
MLLLLVNVVNVQHEGGVADTTCVCVLCRFIITVPCIACIYMCRSCVLMRTLTGNLTQTETSGPHGKVVTCTAAPEQGAQRLAHGSTAAERACMTSAAAFTNTQGLIGHRGPNQPCKDPTSMLHSALGGTGDRLGVLLICGIACVNQALDHGAEIKAGRTRLGQRVVGGLALLCRV